MATPFTVEIAARLFRLAADALDEVAREGAAERREWVDQSASPLGPRRHAAAVRRRLEVGLPGAGKAGRRWLLSPEAIAEELGRPTEGAPDEATALRAELALVRGGRR